MKDEVKIGVDTRVLGFQAGPGCLDGEKRENILLIKLNEDSTYRSHEINTDCAPGTGVFLNQQAVRLDLGIEELSEMAGRLAGVPPSIDKRCAVFAKTDPIDSQQKGHPPGSIAAGLCDGVSLCLADTLIKDRTFIDDICVAGGVALNSRVISALEKILAGRLKLSLMPKSFPPSVRVCRRKRR